MCQVGMVRALTKNVRVTRSLREALGILEREKERKAKGFVEAGGVGEPFHAVARVREVEPPVLPDWSVCPPASFGFRHASLRVCFSERVFSSNPIEWLRVISQVTRSTVTRRPPPGTSQRRVRREPGSAE